jgi:hypothetical protein
MNVKLKYLLIICSLIILILLIILLTRKYKKESFQGTYIESSCYNLNLSPKEQQKYSSTFLYHNNSFVLCVPKLDIFESYQECSLIEENPLYFLNFDSTFGYLTNVASRVSGTFRLKDSENIDGFKHTNRILTLKPSEIKDKNDPTYANYLWYYSFDIHYQMVVDTPSGAISVPKDMNMTIYGRLNNEMFKLTENSEYELFITQGVYDPTYNDSDFDKRFISININEFVDEDQEKIKQMIEDTEIISKTMPDPQVNKQGGFEIGDNGTSFKEWIEFTQEISEIIPNSIKVLKGIQKGTQLMEEVIPEIFAACEWTYAATTFGLAVLGIINMIIELSPEKEPEKSYGPNSYYSIFPPFAGISTIPYGLTSILFTERGTIDQTPITKIINYGDKMLLASSLSKQLSGGKRGRFYLSAINTKVSENNNPLCWVFIEDAKIQVLDDEFDKDEFLKSLLFEFVNLSNLSDIGPVRMCNNTVGLKSILYNDFIYVNNNDDNKINQDKYYWPVDVTCPNSELCKCVNEENINKNYLKIGAQSINEKSNGPIPFMCIDVSDIPDTMEAGDLKFFINSVYIRIKNYSNQPNDSLPGCGLPCNGGELYRCNSFISFEKGKNYIVQFLDENKIPQTSFRSFSYLYLPNEKLYIDILTNNIFLYPEPCVTKKNWKIIPSYGTFIIMIGTYYLVLDNNKLLISEDPYKQKINVANFAININNNQNKTFNLYLH